MGKKFGGGVDTPSLCGRVKKGLGWDLRLPVDLGDFEDCACGDCVAKMTDEGIRLG